MIIKIENNNNNNRKGCNVALHVLIDIILNKSISSTIEIDISITWAKNKKIKNKKMDSCKSNEKVVMLKLKTCWKEWNIYIYIIWSVLSGCSFQ